MPFIHAGGDGMFIKRDYVTACGHEQPFLSACQNRGFLPAALFDSVLVAGLDWLFEEKYRPVIKGRYG